MEAQIFDDATVTVEGKQFGRGRALFPDFALPLPAAWTGENGAARMPLREFLALVVRREVAGYNERQEAKQTLRALTATEIAEGAAKGKVEMGGTDEKAGVADEGTAVKAALQAFEDGLFYTFVDDNQIEKLDDVVTLRPGGRVTFLRLVALAGG